MTESRGFELALAVPRLTLSFTASTRVADAAFGNDTHAIPQGYRVTNHY